LKKPFGKLYNKKKSNNTKGPFEDESTVEFFSLKNDASLFMYGGSSKKRVNNLIVGMLDEEFPLFFLSFFLSFCIPGFFFFVCDLVFHSQDVCSTTICWT
jgi:hypothetical protein